MTLAPSSSSVRPATSPNESSSQLFTTKALKLLPANFAVIGVAVSDGNDEVCGTALPNIKQFATRPVDEKEWDDFARRSYYIQGDFKAIDTFKHLPARLLMLKETWNLPGNVLFYLAVAPAFFATVVEQLHAVGLTNEGPNAWRRVIIEKPFGHDLASGRSLNCDLSKNIDESQIYRIDHYLGKDGAKHHGIPFQKLGL